ncbi:phage major capsid protein [Mycobacterium gordonae]|uniref:phage major capsid protein n=1 Tax=Mycobacterium gordonae TaxID=1778 RepID=UPI00210B5066|nr:phage major capsid protein [Mycobacterium gordonae]MCQ4365834.1 phage major capsid protein [Mycobacterium gordonae]
MALTTSGGASILTPEEVGALVIRPLMETSVAAQVSTVVPTNSHDFRVPIVSADPTAAWTAEGAEITASDPTITEVLVTPRKLAGLTVISNELAADSSPAALQVVGDGLVRDLKRKLDAAYFGNTTTNGPSGLLSLSSTAIDAGDAWTNLDWAEAAKSAAETVHTTLTAFVASPATALALAELKEQTGSNKALLGSDPTQPTSRVIAGLPLYTSPAIADGIVWGIPQAHSIFVVRQDATVVTDTSVYFTSDRVAVRATLRIGFGFTYPAAVVKVAITP